MAKSEKSTIAFTCPHCLTPGEAAAKAVGRPYRCTACHQMIESLRPRKETSSTVGPEDSADEYAIADSTDSPLETAYLTVPCTLCHTRMHATASQIGQRLVCPDCGTSVEVTPTMAPPPPEPPRQPVEFEGSQEYATYSGQGQPPPEDKEVYQKVIPVVCSLCGTRMHATLDLVGRKMACPDCSTATVVPRYVEKKEVKPPRPGDYGVGAATRPEYRRMKEDYRPEKPPDAEGPDEPRPNLDVALADLTEGSSFWWMFNFLGTPEGWGRWIVLCLVGSVPAVLIGWGLGLIAQETFFGIGAGFALCLFGGVIGLIWFSKTAACGLTILEDTAEGNRKIESWPETNFSWDIEVLYVLFALGIGAAPGFLFDRLLGAGALAMPLGMFLISPIAMLGMLETGSLLNPLSPVVWRSLFADWWAWMLFYFSSAVLLGASVLAVACAYGVAGPLGGVIMGPVVVSTMMVYFRLLGGVTWYCAGAVIPPKAPPEPEKRPAGAARFNTPTSAGPSSPIPPSPIPAASSESSPPSEPRPSSGPPSSERTGKREATGPPSSGPPTNTLPPSALPRPNKRDGGEGPSTEGGSLDFDEW